MDNDPGGIEAILGHQRPGVLQGEVARGGRVEEAVAEGGAFIAIKGGVEDHRVDDRAEHGADGGGEVPGVDLVGHAGFVGGRHGDMLGNDPRCNGNGLPPIFAIGAPMMGDDFVAVELPAVGRDDDIVQRVGRKVPHGSAGRRPGAPGHRPRASRRGARWPRHRPWWGRCSGRGPAQTAVRSPRRRGRGWGGIRLPVPHGAARSAARPGRCHRRTSRKR